MDPIAGTVRSFLPPGAPDKNNEQKKHKNNQEIVFAGKRFRGLCRGLLLFLVSRGEQLEIGRHAYHVRRYRDNKRTILSDGD